EERALFRLLDDLLVELRDDAIHDDARVNALLADALAHHLDRLIDVRAHLPDARGPVLVIGRAGEAELVGELVRGLDAVDVIDRKEVEAERMARARLFAEDREEAEVQPIVLGELGARDGAELREDLLVVRVLLRPEGERVVAPLRVIAVVTETRRV